MAEEIEEIPIEVIPDGDIVTRLVDRPHKYTDVEGLIWENTFAFPRGEGESLNWAKYAPPPERVHQLGCTWEATTRQTKPDMRYVGYIETIVEKIKEIRTVRGSGFAVIHDPSKGQGIHHTEVRYITGPDRAYSDLKKGEKSELKLALRKVFGELVLHSCGDLS